MPFPAIPTGWGGPQDTSQFGGTDVPIPEWAVPYISQEQWNQMAAEATRMSQIDDRSMVSGAGLTRGMYLGWDSMSPEERAQSLLYSAATRAVPQGTVPDGIGDRIAQLGFLGAGVGSIFANLPGAAAGAGGAGASDGLTGVVAGNGNPAAVMLPGAGAGTAGAGVTAASNAAWGGAAIPALSQLPSAIATPGAVNALTGTGAAAGAGGAGAAGTGSSVVSGADTAAGATNALSNVPDWVGNYLLPGLNAAIGANAANQASDAMAESSDRSIAEGARQYDTTRNDLMPWLTAGRDALGRLNDPNAFQASPGYEWARTEGQRDIGNSFAARGGAASGNSLRALAEFQTGLAQQDYGNFWNRQAGLAGVGQTTATTLGGLGADRAANTGNYLQNAGAARASGVLGRTNAVQNGIYDGYQNFLYRRRP